jgi:hypothetical protein
MLALTTGNPVYLISTKGARRVWPFSRGCLLLRGTWSYPRIFRGTVLLYIRFCICHLDYDYVSHIINFAILYSVYSTCRYNKQFTYLLPYKNSNITCTLGIKLNLSQLMNISLLNKKTPKNKYLIFFQEILKICAYFSTCTPNWFHTFSENHYCRSNKCLSIKGKLDLDILWKAIYFVKMLRFETESALQMADYHRVFSPVDKYFGTCFKIRIWIELSRKKYIL